MGDTLDEISAERIGQTDRAEGSIGAPCLGSAQRHGEFAVRPGSLVSGVKYQHHAHAAGWLALMLRCPGDQEFDGDFGFVVLAARVSIGLRGADHRYRR